MIKIDFRINFHTIAIKIVLYKHTILWPLILGRIPRELQANHSTIKFKGEIGLEWDNKQHNMKSKLQKKFEINKNKNRIINNYNVKWNDERTQI